MWSEWMATGSGISGEFSHTYHKKEQPSEEEREVVRLFGELVYEEN